MSLFLDSNALLWRLKGQNIRSAVSDRLDSEDELFVSLVSPWELWIKVKTGKLLLPDSFSDVVQEEFSVVTPNLEDCRLAAALPLIHRDPFDRMIVAQAMRRGIELVTSDRKLSDYGVRTILI